MKKIIIITIIAALFVGCGGSSSSLDKAISQVEKALEKVEKNKGNMTPEDWTALEKEMEAPLQIINNALENNQVGVMSTLKVLTLVGKWAAVATEYGVSQLEKETGIDRENFGKEIENAVKELEKSIGNLQNQENQEEKTEPEE